MRSRRGFAKPRRGVSWGWRVRTGAANDGYRPDIDGLRCVAITTVVLSHAGLSRFAGGYIGVDVFFVISGFLITRILWAGLDDYPRSLLGFYERRARRILPALMVAVVATVLVGAFLLDARSFERLARSALATTFFASNLRFWSASGDYFAADVRLDPLLHTWSLAVEEQFYIVFPLVLALVARAGRRRLVPLMVAICAVSFAISVHAIATGRSQTAFYLLQSRAWELGLGAILALTRIPVPSRRLVIEALALVAAAAILLPVFLYDESTPFPGLAALPPCLGAAVLIWLNGARDNLVRTGLSLRPVVFVGLISYSLYVWHWPIMVYGQLLHGRASLRLALATVALSVVVGAASWWFVERPFRRPTGLLRTRNAVFSASGAAIAATAAVAATVLLAGGFPGRLPARAAQAMEAAEDVHPLSLTCRDVEAIGASACRIGAQPAGPRADFLLWGDSHAGAVIGGVERAAELSGRNGFVATKLACAPLLHVERLDQGPDLHCAAFNDAVMAFLGGRDDIPVVILSARWALSAEGTRTDEGGKDALLADVAGNLPSGTPDRNYAIFRAGMRDTVDAILATGRRVVILGGVPEIGWPVPETLARSLMTGKPMPAVPTAADVERRNARAESLFAELARMPGVTFVPVTARFCDPDCIVTDPQRVPVYSDDDHLSRSGATTYLAPLIAASVWGKAGGDQAAATR